MISRIKAILFFSFTIVLALSIAGFCFKTFYKLPDIRITGEYSAKKILHIEFDLSSATSDAVNLKNYFSSVSNEHYSEKYTYMSHVKINEKFSRIKYDLPLPDKLINIRFDLGENPGKFTIKNMVIGGIPINIVQKDFLQLSSDLKISETIGQAVIFESTGDDPYFELKQNFLDLNPDYRNIFKNRFIEQLYNYALNYNDAVIIYTLYLFVAFLSLAYRRNALIPSTCLIFFIILAYFEVLKTDGLDHFRGDLFNTLYKIFFSEFPIALCILCSAVLSMFMKKWYMKILPVSFGLSILFLITADIFTYSQFKTHIIITDILNFYKDGINSNHIIAEFFKTRWFAVLNLSAATILFIFLSCRIKTEQIKKMHIICMVMVLLSCLWIIPEPQTTIWDEMFDNILQGGKASINSAKKYTNSYKYNSYEPQIINEKGLNLRKNVIVIMTESLSADESRLLNGSYDNLRNLDKLAQENIYFSNYYSDGFYTDASNFAFLTSIPFIHGVYFYREQYFSNSVTRLFETQGYTTNLFYSASPIGELNKIYDAAKFNKQYGGNEPFYQNKERLTFLSVPDGDMFDFVISRLSTLTDRQNPSFSLIMTTTTHHPYIVPQTHEKDFHKAVQYVDRAIYDFYLKLKSNHFFDDGILIITGDHRAMLPYTIQERNKFGNIGVAKVPLIIIGLEEKYSIKDVPFSHSSLSSLLQYINLPTVKMYEFNQIPVDKEGPAFEQKPILAQIHEPADQVFVLWKDRQYTIHLNGDDTYIDNDPEMNIQEQILKEITWIRK